MAARYAVSAYDYFRKRRAALFIFVGAVCVLCAVAASRLIVREDVRALLPTEPPRLSESFTLLREAPFIRRLTITVGGPGHDPGALAESFAAALRSEDIPRVSTGPGVSPDPAKLAALFDLLPSLLAPREIPALADLTTPAAIHAALEEDKRLLLTPRGLALRSLVAKDPLGFRTILFRRLAASGGGMPGIHGSRLENGRVVDATGRYGLVFAEPAAPMTDSVAARRVMARVEEAAKNLPEGVELVVVGAHRHTDENASAVKADLAKILPVSFILLGGLFLVFIRSVRGLYLFLLPVLSLFVAVAFAGSVLGGVSGIVIGFGSVVIGITADYAIHVYYAVNAAPDTRKALAGVSRPLATGMVTTLAAFAALLFSSITAIAQMAVFAMAGIAAAFLLALFVLPHCLVPGGSAASFTPSTSSVPSASEPPSARRYGFRGPVSFGIWLLFLACMVFSAASVPVSGDMRKLGYAPKSIVADEEKSARIWKTPSDGMMVATRGGPGEEGLERALETNDAVWEVFASHNLTGGGANPSVISVSPYMAARSTQKTRHAAWKAFWDAHRESTLAALSSLAGQTGFNAAAFAPFRQWIEAEPAFVTPERLEYFGLDVLTRSLIGRDDNGNALVYTLVPAAIVLDERLEKAITAAGGEVVSAEHFREDVSEATRDDCLRFCLVAFLAISGALFVLFRSPGRWALALLPLICGVLAVTAVSRLLGLSLTVFHAAALPLIMGLAADYGIFMVLSLERGDSVATKKAVLLSGLTTLAGFGALVLARHPALYSLGVTVGVGLAVALVAALWGIPRMGRAAG